MDRDRKSRTSRPSRTEGGERASCADFRRVRERAAKTNRIGTLVSCAHLLAAPEIQASAADTAGTGPRRSWAVLLLPGGTA